MSLATNSKNPRLALGVDGGGTKTEAWLAQIEPAGEPIVLGRGKAGSSNPRAVGMELALANLGAAVEAAWADAKLPPTAVDGAVLAMSGAGHVAVQEQIAAWANKRGLAKQLWFKHDAEPVLAEGTPEGWGIALIVGTGSAAIGVDRNQERKIVGGWGYHYGDEGSAYWIGRRALKIITHAADGRGSPTALTHAICARLGVDDPRAILGALESTGNVRGAIASLADAVERVACGGDVLARDIVEEAAEDLSLMVVTLVKKLALADEFPLALAGGVVCGSELLGSWILDALRVRGLNPSPVKMVPHPVAGCLRIARDSLMMEEE